MNNTDAIYAFVNWLSQREHVAVLSARNSIEDAHELVKRFCEQNGMPTESGSGVEQFTFPPLTQQEDDELNPKKYNTGYRRRGSEPIHVKKIDTPLGEYELTHPAFGNINVSRVSGGQNYLHGSEFAHHGYIKIEISGAKMYRGLSREWHHSGGQLIEVQMSNAQWATFVSSFNQGAGTPCTLAWIRGSGAVPAIERTPTTRESFKVDFSDRFRDGIDRADELLSLIDTVPGLSASRRQELSRLADLIRGAMTGGYDFVEKSLDKHLESTLEKAKVELHAIINDAIHQAGVDAFRGKLPLQLEAEPPKATPAPGVQIMEPETLEDLEYLWSEQIITQKEYDRYYFNITGEVNE